MKLLLKRFHFNGQKLQQRTKQIVLAESTAEDVSSEWSHRRISPTSSKVRTPVEKFIFPPGSERVTVVGLINAEHLAAKRLVTGSIIGQV